MLILIHLLSLIRLPQISPIYRFDHPSDDLRVLQVSINLKTFSRRMTSTRVYCYHVFMNCGTDLEMRLNKLNASYPDCEENIHVDADV